MYAPYSLMAQQQQNAASLRRPCIIVGVAYDHTLLDEKQDNNGVLSDWSFNNWPKEGVANINCSSPTIFQCPQGEEYEAHKRNIRRFYRDPAVLLTKKDISKMNFQQCPVRIEHTDQQVGTINKTWFDDRNRLMVEARITDPMVAEYSRKGLYTGLSIGYEVVAKGKQVVNKNLLETSVVMDPMFEECRFHVTASTQASIELAKKMLSSAESRNVPVHGDSSSPQGSIGNPAAFAELDAILKDPTRKVVEPPSKKQNSRVRIESVRDIPEDDDNKEEEEKEEDDEVLSSPPDLSNKKTAIDKKISEINDKNTNLFGQFVPNQQGATTLDTSNNNMSDSSQQNSPPPSVPPTSNGGSQTDQRNDAPLEGALPPSDSTNTTTDSQQGQEGSTGTKQKSGSSSNRNSRRGSRRDLSDSSYSSDGEDDVDMNDNNKRKSSTKPVDVAKLARSLEKAKRKNEEYKQLKEMKKKMDEEKARDEQEYVRKNEPLKKEAYEFFKKFNDGKVTDDLKDVVETAYSNKNYVNFRKTLDSVNKDNTEKAKIMSDQEQQLREMDRQNRALKRKLENQRNMAKLLRNGDGDKIKRYHSSSSSRRRRDDSLSEDEEDEDMGSSRDRDNNKGPSRFRSGGAFKDSSSSSSRQRDERTRRRKKVRFEDSYSSDEEGMDSDVDMETPSTSSRDRGGRKDNRRPTTTRHQEDNRRDDGRRSKVPKIENIFRRKNPLETIDYYYYSSSSSDAQDL